MATHADRIARERDEVAHRAKDAARDISSLTAEILMQAHRPAIHKHHQIDEERRHDAEEAVTSSVPRHWTQRTVRGCSVEDTDGPT